MCGHVTCCPEAWLHFYPGEKSGWLLFWTTPWGSRGWWCKMTSLFRGPVLLGPAGREAQWHVGPGALGSRPEASCVAGPRAATAGRVGRERRAITNMPAMWWDSPGGWNIWRTITFFYVYRQGQICNATSKLWSPSQDLGHWRPCRQASGQCVLIPPSSNTHTIYIITFCL